MKNKSEMSLKAHLTVNECAHRLHAAPALAPRLKETGAGWARLNETDTLMIHANFTISVY